ncbi:tbc1 domain family member 31 isoform x4 [Plasmopara halstedii]|uniref:TBC1 domain family member 31 n=1 Tax=Plasmopara halstedii TaxID=4781 RepID=A0A0P1AR41_PLAHL|nr:tbc1 domain family member 31 isoform x4 [Plasmopara halstedii]CEG43732.1 tbc1 domain family member 31 isoform x4 [Plasmopara halstedii]|eukprot:XP_024580101.1 tbc1 domain family member 31 isoform x4 [Plasmopara halstedii]
MVQTLALRATQDGVIWPRRPLVSSKGLLSRVKNLPLSSYDKRATTFRAVAFNASGELLAATDERGRIFVFFVTANRYSLVQHLGVPIISCCFSPKRKSELLLTCEDETVRCIDVQSQTLISTLKGHRFPAKRISFQESGQLALTASQDAVILWETKDWSKYRVLNAGPGVEEALFVSKGDLVAVCFQDDTIMMWELESLALKYRFSLPEAEKSPGLQKIAVSDDHQVLVASGRAPCIYVWEFESQTIIRIIELPAPIQQVVTHAFLPGHNTMVSILADDGEIFFLDIAARNPQIKLEISNCGRKIVAFDIECHGRYLATTTSDGFLLLYDMAITRETTARAYERRMKEGLTEEGEYAQLRTRFGLHDPTLSELDPSDTNQVAPDFSRPVPSKLIDSLFGLKQSRRTNRALEHTRNGTTLGQTKITRLRLANTERARDQAIKDSYGMTSGKSQEFKNANLRGNVETRRPSPLTQSPAQLSDKEIEVNRKRLVSSLKVNGKFPKKYRALIWRFLLRLPKNEEAFRSLVAKGKHPTFVRLKERYPLQNSRIYRRLHRILSAIVYWCPAFGEVSYLPAMVYPFVKIFKENDLAAFEASICVLLHWCGDYLINLPCPPLLAMRAIESELARRDGQLHDHFTRYQITSEVYAWSLLKTIFTEVLSEEEWMCLWDYLFAYSDAPQLIYVAVLAYLSYYRTALLAACNRLSIEQFFHQQNAIDIQKFVQLVINLREKLDLSVYTAINDPTATDHSTSGHRSFWPLSRGQYPAFAHYPQFVVDFQISERNRIALEEAELARKQDLLEQIKKESEKLQKEHENWMKEREAILKAEEQRRMEAVAAEKERILHLKTLDYETRQRRLQHLSTLETSANETLKETTKLFQTEYQRLESTLAMQKERIEFELSSRQQEEALLRVESETYDRVRNIHKQREMEERMSKLRAEFESRTKQQELEYLFRLESWKREDEKQSLRARTELRRREELTLLSSEKRLRQELENKLLEQQTLKDKALLKLETARCAREQRHQDKSEYIHDISPQTTDHDSTRKQTSGITAHAQKEQDEDSSHHSNQSLSCEKTDGGQQNLRIAIRSRDGNLDSESSRPSRQWNVPTSGVIPIEKSESRPRTPDDAFSDCVIQQLSHRPPSSDSSMSFASASMRRTMAEMSLLEKALGNVSSSMSSSQSEINSVESHVMEKLVGVETPFDDRDRLKHSKDNFQMQEVQSKDRNAWQPVSPQSAHTTPQAANDGIFSPLSVQNSSSKSVHDEEARKSQAARDVIPPNFNDISALKPTQELSAKREAGPKLLREPGKDLSTSSHVLLMQGKSDYDLPLATRDHNETKGEDLSTFRSVGRSHCEDQGPVDNVEPSLSATNQGIIPSTAELQKDIDCDSDHSADSSVKDTLQRPIAELEKRLGIQFDDSSDEDEEDEIIEDDYTHLLQRAKRLLELSSFDMDSDDEL